MDSSLDVLKDTLSNLSSRKHVISDEAINAKRVIDEEQKLTNQELVENIQKQHQLLNEFNVSIKLLTEIFRQTKFDSILGLAVNPTRMLLLNFCIGIFRGMGFSVGVILFISLVLYFFGDVIVTLF